ncbi:MAG TPA: tetratricopeptide repeat protein [Gemmataceae bacterium]|jgi:hypothetical protein
MASDTNTNNPWDRVAAELRACREAQQRAWGDIDNTTLGRYLAGEVTSEEQQHIDNALDELPELRKLTELVRDVLGESEAVVSAPAPSVPAILPFARPTTPRAGRPWLLDARFRQRAGLVAAAGLLFFLGFALPRPSGTSPQVETSLAMSPPVATHVVAFDHEVRFLAAEDDRKNAPAPRLMMVAAGGGQAEEKRKMQDRLDASVRTLEAQGKQREAQMLARQYARNLTRQALVYQEKGDLARAEPALHQACTLCENTLGPHAAETVRTRHSLAGVYAAALNAASPALSSKVSAGVAVKSGPKRFSPKEIQSYETAKMPDRPREGSSHAMHYGLHTPRFQRVAVDALRERITCQSQRELRTSVAPVLTQALREASDAGERQRLMRALGQLGPAAREAVPLLIDCYRQTTDPSERAALLATFGEIGPAARLALPLLADVIQKPDDHPPEVYISAVRALRKVGPAIRRHEKSARLSREVMRYLDSPAGRSGIVDEAECFRVSTIQQGREKIQQLATTHRIEVFIETVPGPTVAALMDKTEENHQNAFVVHLRINKDVPRVQVHISESLRKQGLTDVQLRQALEPHLQKKDFDGGLQASVEFLTAFEGEQGKK